MNETLFDNGEGNGFIEFEYTPKSRLTPIECFELFKIYSMGYVPTIDDMSNMDIRDLMLIDDLGKWYLDHKSRFDNT